MFSRTFAVHARNINLTDPSAVLSFIEKALQGEIVERKPFKFTFFVDADPELKKIVFYDMTVLEHVIEFSSVFARLPQYSIVSDGEAIRMYYFHEERAQARVLKLTVSEGVVRDATPWPEETEKEQASLSAVVSTTAGFLDDACTLDGSLTCSVVENSQTGEKLPFFTLKLEASAVKNRGLIRSCERIMFAWSDQTSYMIFLCRFRMLPPFAMMFTILGNKLAESMALYMKTPKAVGMVMFKGDQSDTFTVEKGVPKFE